jgi:hypothetical protein
MHLRLTAIILLFAGLLTVLATGCQKEIEVREPYKSSLAEYDWAMARYYSSYQTDIDPIILGRIDGQYYLEKLFIDYEEKGFPWKSTITKIQMENGNITGLDIKDIPPQEQLCNIPERIRDGSTITLIQYDNGHYHRIDFYDLEYFLNACPEKLYFKKVTRIDSLLTAMVKD